MYLYVYKVSRRPKVSYKPLINTWDSMLLLHIPPGGSRRRWVTLRAHYSPLMNTGTSSSVSRISNSISREKKQSSTSAGVWGLCHMREGLGGGMRERREMRERPYMVAWPRGTRLLRRPATWSLGQGLCRREDNFASSNCCGSSLTLRLGRRGTVNLDVNAGNTSSLRASGITARMTRRYSRATQPLCRGTERGTEGATRHSRGNEQEQTEGTTWPGTARAGWERGGSGWWWLRRKQLPSRNLPANPRTQDPSGTIPGSQRTLRAMWGWDTGFRCSGDE